MGIDIYLNGCEAWEQRTSREREAFHRACADRDVLPRESAEHTAAQERVEATADAMWAGRTGYLRSSYNGSGLFRVLEEIFGFDVAAYLFPGSWDGDVKVDGEAFVVEVAALEHTAVVALSAGKLELPWLEEFTTVTGERAPDPNETRIKAEAFGDEVFKMVSSMGFDKVAGGPAPDARPKLCAEHRWYLTKGLRNLREFGELARSLSAKGERTFAYISY